MCFDGVIPADQSLFKHDLHEFQGSGITGVFEAGEFFMNHSDAGIVLFPENSQDFKFALGGFDVFACCHRHSFVLHNIRYNS